MNQLNETNPEVSESPVTPASHETAAPRPSRGKKQGKKGPAVRVFPLLCFILAVLFVVSTAAAVLYMRILKKKEEEIISLRTDYARQIRSALDMKEEALSKAHGMTDRLEVLENELAALNAELVSLTAERDELKKTLEDTDPVHEELNAKIAALEKTAADKQAEIDGIVKRLEEAPAGTLTLFSLGEAVKNAPKRVEQITENGADGFPVVREEEVTPAVALCYLDLTAGYSISYGESLSFAPGDLRQLAQAIALLEGEWDSLGETYQYDPEDEVHGSGILKSKPAGTRFTRLELIDLVLRYNDATASHVLSGIYGDEQTDSLLAFLGVGDLTETVTLREAVLLWQEVWRCLSSAEPCSEPLRASLSGAVTSGMSSLFPAGTVLHRYAQSTGAYHDMGIVSDPERPFLLLVLTDMGYMGDDVVSYVKSLETEAISAGAFFAGE